MVGSVDDPAAVARECCCQLGVGAEVDVIRRVDCADAGEVFTEAPRACPQYRPGQGELLGLFLANDRVPLIGPQQPVELGEQPRPVGQRVSAAALGVEALVGEVAVTTGVGVVGAAECG